MTTHGKLVAQQLLGTVQRAESNLAEALRASEAGDISETAERWLAYCSAMKEANGLTAAFVKASPHELKEAGG